MDFSDSFITARKACETYVLLKEDDGFKNIELMRSLTNSSWPKDEQIKSALGEQAYDLYDHIHNSITYPDESNLRLYMFGLLEKKFNPELNYKDITKLFQDAIILQADYAMKMSQINSLLQSVIDMKRKGSPAATEDEIKEIETLAAEFHDIELTKNCRVFHLYNDGEMTSQKGENIYRQRSEHTCRPALIVPHFNFPMKARGIYSYIICTEENAKLLRDKMQKLSSR